MKKRLLSLIFVLSILIANMSVFCIDTSAATKYNCMQTRTITVRTSDAKWWQSDPYIKFACESDALPGIPHDAPLMTLKIEEGGKTSWARISGNGKYISSTLKLKPSKTYKITVSYLYSNVNKGKLTAGTGISWNTGNWYISKTNRISSYNIR